MTRHDETAETRKAPIIAAQAIPPDKPLLSRRPKLALTRKPTNDSRGISSHMKCTNNSRRPRGTRRAHLSLRVLRVPRETFWCLPFQRREHVGIQRFAVAEQAD